MIRPLLLATSLLLAAYSMPCRAQPVSGIAASSNNFTFEMPYAASEASARLRALLLGSTKAEFGKRYRMIFTFGAPLFPTDEQIAVDASRRGPLPDGLTAWLKLPPAARRSDLLLLPDVDYFWPADIVADGRRPLYSTWFILHFEPLAPMLTMVHVLQINGMVRFGKRFDLLGRTGPGFYWDDRPAPPSARAARELINHLTGRPP